MSSFPFVSVGAAMVRFDDLALEILSNPLPYKVADSEIIQISDDIRDTLCGLRETQAEGENADQGQMDALALVLNEQVTLLGDIMRQCRTAAFQEEEMLATIQQIRRADLA